jgi:hypothetical protein
MVIHFDHVWLLNLDLVLKLLGITIDKTQVIDTSTRRGSSDNTVIIPSADNIASSINSIIECAPFFFLSYIWFQWSFVNVTLSHCTCCLMSH